MVPWAKLVMAVHSAQAEIIGVNPVMHTELEMALTGRDDGMAGVRFYMLVVMPWDHLYALRGNIVAVPVGPVIKVREADVEVTSVRVVERSGRQVENRASLNNVHG